MSRKLSVSGVFSVKYMYVDLINSGPIPKSLHTWTIKMPLKVKITVYVWFVRKEVILTKDNLAKRSWKGSKRCCLCDQDESIQHLFLKCPLAKLLWRTLHVAFNVSPPNTIAILFRTWLNGVKSKIAAHIRIRVCVLLWAI